MSTNLTPLEKYIKESVQRKLITDSVSLVNQMDCENENHALGYQLCEIPSGSKIHSVRALWNRNSADAELMIANKRLSTDETLEKLQGVQFFLSCITGTKSNGDVAGPSKIGISYFICGSCVESSIIFSTLHDANLDVDLSLIKTKKADKVEATLKELSIVLKDHNSGYATGIMNRSVLHCLTSAQNARETDVISSENFKNFDKNPCRLVVCDDALVNALTNAVFNLSNDGLNIKLVSCRNTDMSLAPPALQSEPICSSSNALSVVGRAMKNAGHSLYRGSIYCKYDGAEYAYKYMCGVEEYLNTLLTIQDIQGIILKNWAMLNRMISTPYCKVLPQLTFLEDLIEIRGGKCLKLSSRYFIDTPLGDGDLGVRSPRGFHDYVYSPQLDGGYFESSVKNSFPDVCQRANFLNKFYQCLLVGQLPLKTRKLLVVGPADSGKSSWAEVLFGIVPENKVAMISKEKCFGFSMIEEDTQLIVIDEWSSDMFGSDQAKIFLQGGSFTQSVKHQTPRMLHNEAGVYITCNNVPDFGNEQENVERRLAIFHTSSLVEKNVEAPAWMKANAMQCLVWMMNEINRNIDMVDPSERFYEKRCNEIIKARTFGKIPMEQENKVRSVSIASLTPVYVEKAPVVNEDILNASFTSLTAENHHNVDFGVTALHATENVNNVDDQQPGPSHLNDKKTDINDIDDQQPGPSLLNDKKTGSHSDAIAGERRNNQACIQQNAVTSSSDIDSETEKRLLASSDENMSDEKEDLLASKDNTPLEEPLSPFSLDWKSKEQFSIKDVNNLNYHKEVRRIVLNSMDCRKNLKGIHYLRFTNRYDRCKGRSYRGAEPSFDAWMLVKGENRKVFDTELFFKRYPSIRKRLLDIRKRCNIRITESFETLKKTHNA